MLATKLRALLQRKKDRDLVDLSHVLKVFPDLSAVKVVELRGRYLALSDQAISRAQAEERMFGKLDRADFLSDVRPAGLPYAARVRCSYGMTCNQGATRQFGNLREQLAPVLDIRIKD